MMKSAKVFLTIFCKAFSRALAMVIGRILKVTSALFNYGDLARLLFESELYRSYPESCGTGCSKVSSQQGCYCSELWIGA